MRQESAKEGGEGAAGGARVGGACRDFLSSELLSLEAESGANRYCAGHGCGWLAEGGGGRGGIGSGAECSRGKKVVAVVECVEGFGDALKAEAFAEGEGAAETGVHVEAGEADCRRCGRSWFRAERWRRLAALGVRTKPAGRDAGRGLDAVLSGGDVEGERGVVLEYSAELEAMGELAEQGRALVQGSVQGAVDDDAVALVVVGEAAVFAEVVVVDRRGEEELADVVDRLGPSVGEAEAAIPDGALNIGDGEGVEVGVRAGGSTACCCRWRLGRQRLMGSTGVGPLEARACRWEC